MSFQNNDHPRFRNSCKVSEKCYLWGRVRKTKSDNLLYNIMCFATCPISDGRKLKAEAYTDFEHTTLLANSNAMLPLKQFCSIV